MRIRTKEDLLSLSLENPEDFQCDICNNTRSIIDKVELPSYDYKIDIARECSCVRVINALKRIKKSNLRVLIGKYRFDNYRVENETQKLIFDKAKEFVESDLTEWFFVGGKVGTGKTHICVAIASYLLIDKRMSTRYVVWQDIVRELNVNMNSFSYDDLVCKLQNEEVLYIDDFLKTPRGEVARTGDLNRAFEILNARYNNNLVTIISSEHSLDEIARFDTAISSRIIEKAKNYNFTIKNLKDMRKE